MNTDLDGELELIKELRNELIVSQSLPHLHDPHDSCVDLVLTILEHALRRVYVLFRLEVTTR